jgi:hypothetical protein
MYKSVLMKFDSEILKIIEAFNIYPRSKNIQGLQAPVPSTNINSTGSLPVGFKGSGPAGIAPSSTSTILIKSPKKKKIKKKKDFSL